MLSSLAGTLAYSCTLAVFCGSIVYEREKKLKYALNVMGCRTFPYWLGTFAFDYILFCVIASFFILFGVIFSLEVVSSYVGQWIVVLLTMGLSFLSWTYLWTFIFEKAASAEKYFVNK